MYLLSLYFDKDSSSKIQKLIDRAALKSGNNFMIDGEVPPHITIAAFQFEDEKEVIEVLDKTIGKFKEGIITWASVGVFKSSVIFLAPVLNNYIHNLSVEINNSLRGLENMSINKFYVPFQWMPHTTIAKKLSREELLVAFEEVERNFVAFNGMVTSIGLSKTGPCIEVKRWNIYKENLPM